jgi:hypothetical protein
MRTIGKDQILISASWENSFSQEINPRTNLPTNNTELLPARTGKETVKVFFYLKYNANAERRFSVLPIFARLIRSEFLFISLFFVFFFFFSFRFHEKRVHLTFVYV